MKLTKILSLIATFLALLCRSEKNSWEKHIENTNEINYIAKLSGKIVGFISGGKAREAAHGYDGEIYAIYILKKYQKRNIGRALFESLINDLRHKQMSSMYVFVLRDNVAVNFYKAMGGIKGTEIIRNFSNKELIEDLYYWNEI